MLAYGMFEVVPAALKAANEKEYEAKASEAERSEGNECKQKARDAECKTSEGYDGTCDIHFVCIPKKTRVDHKNILSMARHMSKFRHQLTYGVFLFVLGIALLM